MQTLCPPALQRQGYNKLRHARRLEFKSVARLEKAGGGVKAADHDILSPKAPKL
jgi:hypothetical protein